MSSGALLMYGSSLQSQMLSLKSTILHYILTYSLKLRLWVQFPYKLEALSPKSTLEYIKMIYTAIYRVFFDCVVQEN